MSLIANKLLKKKKKEKASKKKCPCLFTSKQALLFLFDSKVGSVTSRAWRLGRAVVTLRGRPVCLSQACLTVLIFEVGVIIGTHPETLGTLE